MKKDFKYYVEGFAIMLLLLWLFMHLSACVTDRKALGRVLTNPDLVAQVAKTLPPCANDTTIVTDTAIVIDTKWLPGDTIYQYSNDTLLAIIRDTLVKVKQVKVIQTIVDNRLAAQWRDSADKYRNEYLKKDAQYITSIANLKDAKQSGSKKTWVIISLIIALVASSAAWAYLKFRKP